MDDTSRAELFATQSLGRDPKGIMAKLCAAHVVIGIDAPLASTKQGQVGLVTATNILGRLGGLLPNLHLDVPSEATVLAGVPLLPPGEPLGESLLALTQRLACLQHGVNERRAADRAHRYDYGLFIGRASTAATRPVTVGSERWLAAVRPDSGLEPVDTSDPNAMGMILAAALGSAEVVKHMWLPICSSSVGIEPVERRVVVSAYDFSVDPKRPHNPPMPDSCDLGHACVFGLGATGSGCMFILGCLPGVQMSLDLVDMDHRIEPSNTERLFTCRNPKTDVGRMKTDHAVEFIRASQPAVRPFTYPVRFQEFVSTARDRLGYVWCCLDSARARRELQTELPSVVVNGGTDASSGWTVSLHEFDLPQNACLADLYPEPKSRPFDPIQELARALRVGVGHVRRWAVAGRAINTAVVDRAAAREKDAAKRHALLALKGRPYLQAVAQVCSTMRPAADAPAATISFVALMPAVAMVADLVKRRVYGWRPTRDQPNVFHSDVFRSPTRLKAMRVLASRRCLCQSQTYRRAFEHRQQLRRRHLGGTFTKPTGGSAP